MRRSRSKPPVELPEMKPSPAMLAVVYLLREARVEASQLNFDIWQFAVSIQALMKCDVGETDIRRLIAGGLAEHRHEQLKLRAGKRSFLRSPNLALTPQSCFVLTPAGESFLPLVGAKPRWDHDHRQLWFGHLLVKEYRQRADNQELILTVFEEEGWPPRIDDPLPRHSEFDPRDRLHMTVRRLNDHQRNRLLKFRCDGIGEGVTWRGR